MFSVRYLVACLLFLSLCAAAQSQKPKRIGGGGELVAQEVDLNGTTTLESSQLTEISNALTSVTMHDSDEEIEERIKYEFMQHGYYDVDVTNLKVTQLDPLAKKKPVRIEADVSEGPQFRLAQLIFKGGKPFTADELYAMFELKTGDVFNAEKVRKGLETMREAYAAKGFLNFAPIPDTEKSGAAQITLTINVDTGPQFHMGDLKFEGPPDVGRALATSWELQRGEPYDPAYLESFVAQHRERFPETFNRDRDVVVVQDCPQKNVDVTFELDPKAPRTLLPKDKPCETKDAGKGSQ